MRETICLHVPSIGTELGISYLYTNFCGSSSNLSHRITLVTSASYHHVVISIHNLRHNVLQLPNLVATKGKAGVAVLNVSPRRKYPSVRNPAKCVLVSARERDNPTSEGSEVVRRAVWANEDPS